MFRGYVAPVKLYVGIHHEPETRFMRTVYTFHVHQVTVRSRSVQFLRHAIANRKEQFCMDKMLITEDNAICCEGCQ